MTPQEFRDWLKSQQKPGKKPKPALVPREPGDESDFAAVSNLADRLQRSITVNRLGSRPVKYADLDSTTRARDERIVYSENQREPRR